MNKYTIPLLRTHVNHFLHNCGQKIGHISKFRVTNDDWDIYVDLVKLFLNAKSVKNDMQVTTFLTIMGNEAYKKLILEHSCMPLKLQKHFPFWIRLMSHLSLAILIFFANKLCLNQT